MTPQERAVYLIKELGTDKAKAHASWVISDCQKQLTKEYWQEVLRMVCNQVTIPLPN